jgi:Winged helix-turn-helix DNA-binding
LRCCFVLESLQQQRATANTKYTHHFLILIDGIVYDVLDNMLTIAEIAERVGLPPSTTRDYIRRFKQYFKAQNVVGSKHPKYTDDAESVMREILKGYREGHSTEELHERLKTLFPIIIDSEIQQRGQTDDSEPRAGKSSLDIIVMGQAQIFQSVQALIKTQTEVLQQNHQLIQRSLAIQERNNELMERMIEMLEKREEKQKHPIHQQTKKTPANVTTGAKNGKKNPPAKPSKNKQPEKQSFWGKLFR